MGIGPAFKNKKTKNQSLIQAQNTFGNVVLQNLLLSNYAFLLFLEESVSRDSLLP